MSGWYLASRTLAGSCVVIDVTECFGFVRLGIVDNHEERLSLLQFLPIQLACIPRALVVPTANVVIRLAGIRSVITGRAKQVGVVLDLVMRNQVAAAHRLSAVRDCVHAGDPARTGRRANGRVVEAIQVAKTFFRQTVDRRRVGVDAAIATDPRDAVVFAGDPKDVGTVVGRRNHGR